MVPLSVEILHGRCLWKISTEGASLSPMTRTQAAELHATIAQNMRAIRQERGWSQEQLAERAAAVGLPWNRSWVADLENGRRYVSVEEIILLPLALEVEVSDLLGRGPVRVGSVEVSSRTILKLLGGHASQVRNRDIRLQGRGTP